MEKRVSKVEALPRLAPEFRVAAYARVSSEKDAMRHSLSAQVSYYSNLIQSHPGWQYAGVYADEPISGTKDCREEFQRMLSDCRAEDQYDHHEVYFPVRPEHRHPAGNGTGAQKPGHRRIL